MAFLVADASKTRCDRGYRRACGGDAGEELKLPGARAMLLEGDFRDRTDIDAWARGYHRGDGHDRGAAGTRPFLMCDV